MERLLATHRALESQTDMRFLRYMHNRIDWSSRLIGIVGPRGVGKTTLMLQHLKAQRENALFVTAEDFYFANHRIGDLANQFAQMGGKVLYIDEIHKLKEWARELKLIYDLHPELRIVFSGSSILDINKGATADLSRRAILYHMQGLSFREYLKMFHNIESEIYTLDDVLANRVALAPDVRPLLHFKQYLQDGYYPFRNEGHYSQRLMGIVNQTLEIDIPQYAQMHSSTSHKLKQLLSIVADSVPFKPNMKAIADSLNVSRNNVADYLLHLEEVGLIAQLRDATGGIRSLGKVDKVYLDNTNLAYALTNGTPDIGNIRKTFFMNQLRVTHDPITSPISDFLVGDVTFEIGGRKKGNKQIMEAARGIVVKDDIEYGMLNTVPLWAFGMMY